MREFNSQEAINANEGVAYFTQDSQNHELFYAKSINAKMTKNKQDVRAIGKRSVGKKTTSWSGAGTLVIQGITSRFKQMFVDYANKGKDVYFSLTITNHDPSTPYGRETKILIGCNLDEVEIANLINDDGLLEQQLPFTFEGVELPETFSES